MIVFVGYLVLLLGTFSSAENVTCTSACSPDPDNSTESCNATSGECLFGCEQGFVGKNCSRECPKKCQSPSFNDTDLCDFESGNCISGCRDGYTGPTCACLENCLQNENITSETCDDRNGTCTLGCKQGFSGSDCSYKCPDNCGLVSDEGQETCDSSNGDCVFGCRQGYAGKICSKECPDNCSKPRQNNTETCNASTNECLHGCENGLAGPNCSYKCPENCSISQDPKADTCNISSGECLLGCKHGFAGSNCNFSCPTNCGMSDEINTQTCNVASEECFFGCLPGYSGPNCSFECPSNCSVPKQNNSVTCNDTTAECLHGCKKGFAGPNCSYECPTNCKLPAEDGMDTCNYTNDECLLGCKDGYAGSDCSFECPTNCLYPSENDTGTCNYMTGECLHGCNNGTSGVNCSVECPENCAPSVQLGDPFCNATSRECIYGCNQSYAGDNCSVKCPDLCAASGQEADAVCNATSGECLYGCNDDTFYGPNCTKKCSDVDGNCIRCSEKDNSGVECTECDRNFYRENGKCVGCNYWCIILRLSPLTCRESDGYCYHGCRPGHYGFKCGQKCSATCSDTCHRDTGTCTGGGCRYTTYCGPTCQIPCQDGCMSQHCNQSCDCVKGCNTKYWGDQCQNLCYVKCNPPVDASSAVCDIDNGRCNNGCEDNKFWDIQCDKLCSKDCVNETCQQDSGNCTEGCTNTTVYGWKCDKECNANCIGGTCERADGNCNKGCKEGNYGNLCDKKCSANCVSDTCKREDGYCDSGCKDGWFDDQCNEECSRFCLNLKCERTDGNCSEGCISGYEGVKCETVSPLESPPPSTPNNWIYVAIGCAALVAICVLVTIVLVTKKRRQIAKRRRTARMSTLPDEEVLEENQRRHKRKAEGTGARLTQLFVENPLARFMNNRSHGGDLITKIPIKNILVKVIKMDENDFGREFDEFKIGLIKSHEAARKTDNLALNFFSGIYPYDENRVILRHSFEEENVNRKSKVKRGILKSVHFTTFRPNRDSTYETLEASRKELGDSLDKEKSLIGKRKNKGKGENSGYSSVVFDFKDELGASGEESRKPNDTGISDDYATVQIGGTDNPSFSRKDEEPLDYAKVISDDSPEGKPVHSYDHLHEKENGMAAETNKTGDGSDYDYALLAKGSVSGAGSYNHIKGADSSDTGTAEAAKDEENCDYAVVHKDKPGDMSEGSANAREPTRQIQRNEDGSVTIKKDYINASFIKGHNQNEKYIAAQAPSKLTANDFWIMAWEQKSSFVIMLTEIPEDGFSRCEKYWPDVGKDEVYGEITITCETCDQYADYIVRLLKLSLKNGHERDVVHLQFTAWPEEGCPVSAIDFIQFHQKYRALTKGRNATGATIVHCTAGVGRTGVFIALDILVEEGLDSLNVDVFKCVNALREQRVDMVRSQDQYEFLYKALAQTFALEVQPCHKIRLQDKLTELKKFDHDSGKSKLELLYQNLKASLMLDTAEIATVDVVQERKRKDRPTSDVPDVLFRPDLPQNMYINAVIFESLKKKESMVATQMPTPDTLQDFCQLIVYHQCATVIMLNTVDPNDKTNGIYWPTGKTPVVAGKMIVSQINIEKESDYIIRQLRIHSPETGDDSPAHSVTMVQFKGWKIVKNVPNAKMLLKLLILCQRYIKDMPDKRLLVHCMNGAEQSGLFCALVNLFEIVDNEAEVSVTGVVRKILARLPNAIPNSDQLEMCFAATCEYIKKS